MDQVFNITVNQPVSSVLFLHVCIIYINVTLEVKMVIM